jgi:hypothetical protein
MPRSRLHGRYGSCLCQVLSGNRCQDSSRNEGAFDISTVIVAGNKALVTVTFDDDDFPTVVSTDESGPGGITFLRVKGGVLRTYTGTKDARGFIVGTYRDMTPQLATAGDPMDWTGVQPPPALDSPTG